MPTNTYIVFIGLEAVFESLNVPYRQVVIRASNSTEANELAELECEGVEYVLEVTRIHMEK